MRIRDIIELENYYPLTWVYCRLLHNSYGHFLEPNIKSIPYFVKNYKKLIKNSPMDIDTGSATIDISRSDYVKKYLPSLNFGSYTIRIGFDNHKLVEIEIAYDTYRGTQNFGTKWVSQGKL